jgi:predicted acylesterase/phospholipase RssA
MGGWDVRSSSYVFPMGGMELLNATGWPALARMLGPDNPWMRPDFFSLPDLLRPGVDWPLVELLGEFASIPVEVERWQRSELEEAMFPPTAPCQERYRAERGAAEARIADKLGAADRLRTRMEQLGIGSGSLLHAALERWRPPAVRFDADGLGELNRAVQHALRPIPHLILGAVDLHEGEFVTFSSERAQGDGGISMDAVLASAAFPWLFRPGEMAATDERTLAPQPLALWDGLFSQTPPIRNFLSGLTDDARKPDEIWVVQSNPAQAKAGTDGPHALLGSVFSGGETRDLRNALAGNLALNQELRFVDAINRRTESGRDDDASVDAAERRHDKQVRVDRIVMDGSAVEAAAGVRLGANSKLDRDPRLRGALWDHGTLQARRYLALRRDVGSLCGDLDGALAGACACAAGMRPDGAAGTLRPDGAARLGEVVVDGVTVHAIAPDAPGMPQAYIRWRSAHTQIYGWPVRIEGRTELAAGGDADAGWQLKDVRITAVVPRQPVRREAAPARRPAGRTARQPGAKSLRVKPPSDARH